MIKMSDWFIYSIIALLVWGVAGFLAKYTTNQIDPKSVLFYQILGMIIIGIIVLFLLGFKPATDKAGISLSILRGLLLAGGTLLFLIAIDKGKASVVITITALYPLITIALATTILREPITFKEGLGIIFALLAMVLFAV